MTDPLFKGRTPEAAARQLAIVLASATEMHLATLEWWQLRKSTPKSELKRQESICETLVAQCADLGIQPGVRGLRGTICVRLSERLSAANTEEKNGECHCEACDPIRIEVTPEGFMRSPNVRMILCAICGNKRCPHATDHRNACTNNNAPGQPGSSYAHCGPAANTEATKPQEKNDGN